MRRVLLLSALLAVALLYTLWSARPAWSDAALLIVLAVAVRATWAGWDVAAPRALRWPFAALVAAYALSSAFAPDQERAWRATGGVFAYGLAYALVGNVLRAGVTRDELYRALVIASQVIVAALVTNWLMHGAPLYGWRFRVETNNSLFHWNQLILPALIVGRWRGRVTAEWVGVAWYSASRSGLLGLLAACAALRGPARRWRGALLLLAVVPLVSVALRSGSDLRGGLVNGQGRSQAWALAVRMWLGSPLVGQGPDSFKGWWLAGGPRAYAIGHAHNVYLNLAAETGVIGLAAAAWLAGALVLALWKRAASDPWAAAALAATAAMLAESVFDVPTTAPYIALTWLALVRAGISQDVFERRPGGDNPLQAQPA